MGLGFRDADRIHREKMFVEKCRHHTFLSGHVTEDFFFFVYTTVL